MLKIYQTYNRLLKSYRQCKMIIKAYLKKDSYNYYIDAKYLRDISSTIEMLPAVSIDHLGLSEEGLPHLLKLVDKGMRVKATGFGRVELNVENALKSIYDVNPDALMFGTDLPST